MMLIESLKKRKFLLFNIFFTLYIAINLIGGERGLKSYLDKKKTYKKLNEKDKKLTVELKDLDKKIKNIKLGSANPPKRISVFNPKKIKIK